MSATFDRGLCWLRRDLRLYDNAALSAATSVCREVVVAFVLDTNILEALPTRRDTRVTFILRSLDEIDRRLAAFGSRLVWLHGDPVVEVPKLVRALGVQALFAGEDYEPYARKRDAEVQGGLTDRHVEFVRDSVGLEPSAVLSQTGAPFQVYSPYRRAWQKRFDWQADAAERVTNFERLLPNAAIAAVGPRLGHAELGFEETEPWLPAGEDAARARLDGFVNGIAAYDRTRDYPAVEGTSVLSPHLRFGTISTREVLRTAATVGGQGAETWISELIWRDFFQHLLYHFPSVVDEPFQAKFRGIHYPGTREHFDAWCEGRTGYPIVDAAMRCLNETGWMHNRLRMVVASFLTKDLLVDYRLGEAYFAEKLLDFDLASNCGNWQWAASVGADAQPYFRMFNPMRQSERFDASGEFIRRYVPELAELSAQAIHQPSSATEFDLAAAGVRLGETYPLPIVNHDVQRQIAIRLLSEAAARGAT